VALILNTRYNDNQSTIITTNYPYGAVGSGFSVDGDEGTKPAKYEDTLGDRIGNRILSRLAEMCIRVHMNGKDRRRGKKKAHFG
jgi:DNA replication protein DnaC